MQLLELRGSGNNGHLFRAYSDQLQRDFACKVVPTTNLVRYGERDEAWKQEIQKANALRSSAVVPIVDLVPWRDDAIGLQSVVIISEFIQGPSLKEFILDKNNTVDVSLIRQFMETMLDLLNEMQEKHIEHGDLHEGNIIVQDRSFALSGPRYAFRVTDFGVTQVVSESVMKDDFSQLAMILKKLLERVDYPGAPPRDKFVYNALNNDFLSRHLVERDPTRDPLARNARGMFDRLSRLQVDFDSASDSENTRLVTPFDFLSCEQIGDRPALLQALYSERFLGLDQIESLNNTVVTGPRGCGKSTVFKCVSLKHRIRVNDDAPENIGYIGVYYRCDDLYFAFPRYQVPVRAEAIDLPCHFLTATLLGELLDVVETWCRRHFPVEFEREELSVARQVWSTLELESPKQPGAESFSGLRSELARQRMRAVNKARFVNDPNQQFGSYFGVQVLPAACAVLNQSLTFLNERPFYFLVDDYSSPKITRALQENLNRIFMQRLAFCFFKLSTESPVSYSRGDIDSKIYVEGREFILHNLGLVYLHAKRLQKLEFIEDVFRRRLAAPRVSYPVQEIEHLLGTNAAENNNEDARRLREGAKIELWGKEVLSSLCSGDVHYLIQLVADMVGTVGGEAAIRASTTMPRISPIAQNRAIREAAGVFLKSLRSIPRHGDKVVAIVTAFGNVARSFLLYRDSKNEKGNPPHQATRIEPYDSIELDGEARELYQELLRYSVFIEDFRGKSRRGKVVPRLYLRRFLIPHFNLTFSTRDSISLEPADFELFLCNPTQFEEKFRLKTTETIEDTSIAARSEELPFGDRDDYPPPKGAQ